MERTGADRLELLLPPRRIAAAVGRLARRIDADYRGGSLSLVVVLKGAFVFAGDLARRLATPLRVDFIAASSYGAAIRPVGDPVLAGIDGLALAGRDVIIVEDVLDSGHTAAAILAALRPHRPRSLALCALLRKPAAATGPEPAAYVGFDIAGDFVVGYGMDYGERYRNLPGIYRLVAAG